MYDELTDFLSKTLSIWTEETWSAYINANSMVSPRDLSIVIHKSGLCRLSNKTPSCEFAYSFNNERNTHTSSFNSAFFVFFCFRFSTFVQPSDSATSESTLDVAGLSVFVLLCFGELSAVGDDTFSLFLTIEDVVLRG